MRTIRLTATLLAAFILSACGKPPAPRRPETMDLRPRATTRPTSQPADGRVVAAGMLQVGQRFMTIKEVMTKGRQRFELLNRLEGNLPVDQFRAKASVAVAKTIQQVVQDTLTLDEAERELTSSQKEQIASRVQSIKATLLTEAGGSEEQLRDKLKRNDLDLKEVLEDNRRKLTIAAYDRQKFILSIVITRKMMWKFYTDNLKVYKRGAQVRLRTIAVPIASFLPVNVTTPTDAQRKAAKSKAREMVREAAEAVTENGEPFEGVAKRVGKSIRDEFGDKWDKVDFRGKGRIDLMLKGGLGTLRSPESFKDDVLARAARELKEGDLSREETDHCCYLIKADRVARARNVSFEEAQESIMKLLRDHEYARRKQEYFSGKLALLNELHTRKAKKRFAEMVLARVMHDYYQKQ